MQSDPEKILQKPHDQGPVPNGLNVKAQYAKMQFSNFSVQMCTGNNCVQLKNKDVVVVKNLVVEEHGETFIVYSTFRNKADLFVYPLPSSQLDIFLLSGLKDELLFTQATNLLRKFVLLPCKEHFAGLPLLHL